MRRLWRRSWKWILGVVIVLALANGAASLILGRQFAAALDRIKAEGSPVSTAELGGPAVADSDNAALVYQRIFKGIRGDTEKAKQRDVLSRVPEEDGARALWSTLDEKNPTANDHQTHGAAFWTQARQASASFADVQASVESAVSLPDCQFPVNWSDGNGAVFPHFAELRNLQLTMAGQAVLEARAGNTDGAFKTIDLMFRMAEKTCNEPIPIGLLVKLALLRNTIAALVDVLKYGSPSPEEAASLQAHLHMSKLDSDLVRAMKGERAFGLWTYDFIRRGGARDLYDFFGGQQEPLSVRRWFSSAFCRWRPRLYADGMVYLDYMGKEVKAAGIPYRLWQRQRLDESADQMPSYAYVAQILTPVFSRARASVDDARAQAALAQVLLAAQQYKKQRGQYPASLAELSSGTGWKAQLDPFSGKSLIYKKTAKGILIYSIGANLKDDGGVSGTKGDPYAVQGDRVLVWNQ